MERDNKTCLVSTKCKKVTISAKTKHSSLKFRHNLYNHEREKTYSPIFFHLKWRFSFEFIKNLNKTDISSDKYVPVTTTVKHTLSEAFQNEFYKQQKICLV